MEVADALTTPPPDDTPTVSGSEAGVTPCDTPAVTSLFIFPTDPLPSLLQPSSPRLGVDASPSLVGAIPFDLSPALHAYRLQLLAQRALRTTGRRTPAEALAEFKHIWRSEYNLPNVRRPPPSSAECACRPVASGGCGYSCMNRLLQYECTPKSCPVESVFGPGSCTNQRLQRAASKASWSKTLQVRSAGLGRGCGLYMMKPVPKGSLIIEYVGEVIDEEECDRRLREDYRFERHKYLMCMSKGLVIDATRKGSVARFMNHSCSPNCVVEEWRVNGEARMGIFALRDLNKNEEVCFDYNFKRFGEAQECCCGAPNCRGALGVSDPRMEQTSQERELKRMKSGIDPVMDDQIGLTMTEHSAHKMERSLRLLITHAVDDFSDARVNVPKNDAAQAVTDNVFHLKNVQDSARLFVDL